MRWMAAAGHFSPYGAKSWKSMLLKTLLAKFCSAKDDRRPGSSRITTYLQITNWI